MSSLISIRWRALALAIVLVAGAAQAKTRSAGSLAEALEKARVSRKPVLVIACDGDDCYRCNREDRWQAVHAKLAKLLRQFEVAVHPIFNLAREDREPDPDSFRLELIYMHEFCVLDPDGSRILETGYLLADWNGTERSFGALERCAQFKDDEFTTLAPTRRAPRPALVDKIESLGLLAPPGDAVRVEEGSSALDLVRIISEKDSFERYRWIRAVGKSGRADLAPVPLYFLDDFHVGVREAAARCLCDLGDRDSLERAAHLIRSGAVRSASQGRILDGLIEQKSPTAVPWLIEMIESSGTASSYYLSRLADVARETGDRRALHGLVLPLLDLDRSAPDKLDQSKRLLELIAPAIRKLTGGHFRWEASLSLARQLKEIERMKRWYTENWMLLDQTAPGEG